MKNMYMNELHNLQNDSDNITCEKFIHKKRFAWSVFESKCNLNFYTCPEINKSQISSNFSLRCRYSSQSIFPHSRPVSKLCFWCLFCKLLFGRVQERERGVECESRWKRERGSVTPSFLTSFCPLQSGVDTTETTRRHKWISVSKKEKEYEQG